MDRIDITPTPEACRQIAQLFLAQRADAEALAAHAARALDDLDTTGDDALAPWGRGLRGWVGQFRRRDRDETGRRITHDRC